MTHRILTWQCTWSVNPRHVTAPTSRQDRMREGQSPQLYFETLGNERQSKPLQSQAKGKAGGKNTAWAEMFFATTATNLKAVNT